MQSQEEIETWLKSKSITDYVILGDMSVTVHGNVNLDGILIEEQCLPVTFKIIDGYFNISNNKLKSLSGCPNIVTKDFNCSNNKLDSLFDAPFEVGDFNCSNNNLISLSYGPKHVRGYYDCANNQIGSLKGCPRTIKGYFKCSNNKLTTLSGAPKYVNEHFDCSHNLLEKLSGGPSTVGQDYKCHGNILTDLDGIADEIGWDLTTDIRLNHIDSAFNEEEKTWRYKGNAVSSHIYKPVVALTEPEDISKWLAKVDIKKYSILKDNSVDIQEDVKLQGKLDNLLKLPINFNSIIGSFDISDNELISLEGSPKRVEGDFLAHKNELSSLRGAPKEVGGNFIVLQNNISSLKNSPAMVKGDFICSHNPLKSLEGINSVGGSVFTGIYIPKVKSQKFVYKSVATYKYPGESVEKFLDQEYISFTDEEIAYEQTRKNFNKVISKMISSRTLTKEMITDTLITNLKKYHLDDLLEKVLTIKHPPQTDKAAYLSEDDIKNSMFLKEL